MNLNLEMNAQTNSSVDQNRKKNATTEKVFLKNEREQRKKLIKFHFRCVCLFVCFYQTSQCFSGPKTFPHSR